MKPEIGMGATKVVGSDRYPCTIIDITSSGKTLTVQEDKATRLDNNGMSSLQEYLYEENPDGEIERFRMTKRGWRNGSVGLIIGTREKYYDFDF